MTYLCGGINGLADSECKDWRAVATERLGRVIDPMRRDYRGIEDQSVAEIVADDLVDISFASYVLVNATKPSWGTAMEIVYAHQLGKRISAFTGGVGRVSPWLRFHCTNIFDTIERACEEIEAWQASD